MRRVERGGVSQNQAQKCHVTAYGNYNKENQSKEISFLGSGHYFFSSCLLLHGAIMSHFKQQLGSLEDTNPHVIVWSCK